jgi:hypothetical protein
MEALTASLLMEAIIGPQQSFGPVSAAQMTLKNSSYVQDLDGFLKCAE